MFVGVLQFELLIHGAASLKDKRRVVHSVRDRLHRAQLVSVAEVGLLDRKEAALMGLAVVAATEQRAHVVMDRALEALRSLRDAELGEHQRRLIRAVDAMPLACDETPPLLTDDERCAWRDVFAADAGGEASA